MKNTAIYKKILGLGLLAVVATGCTSSVSWSAPEIVTTFMKSCNPSNDAKMQTVCQCVIDKFSKVQEEKVN